MADNAVYDVNAPGTIKPQLQQMQADAQRQAQLETQGIGMIAPSPLQMTPAEQSLSMQKQAGVYNPGGPMDMNAMLDEGQLAQQAYPQVAEQGMESQAQPTEPPNQYASQMSVQPSVKPAGADSGLSGINMQLRAQQDYANAAKALDANNQVALSKREAEQTKEIDAYRKLTADYDVKMAEKMSELDTDMKRVEQDAITARKGTAELFGQKSTGQKIQAGIAMILGAVGGVYGNSSKNLGTETVMNSLQDERANNLKNYAQSKDMLELRRKSIDDYNNAIQQHVNQLDKATLLQMQFVDTKLQQAASQYKGSAAGAAALDASGQLTTLKEQLKAQIAQRSALSGLNTDSLTPAQIEGLPLPENLKKTMIQERELRVPGYVGVANSKMDRDKFQEYRSETEPAIDALKRVMKLQKISSRLSPKDRGVVEAELNGLVGQLRLPLTGPGILTESEREMLKNSIGNPNRFLSLPAWEQAKMRTIMQKLEKDTATKAGIAGLKSNRANIPFEASDSNIDKLASKYGIK